MNRLIPRLNLLATCLLAGVLVVVLGVRARPLAPVLARAAATQVRPSVPKALQDEWRWPKTLQVCPAHPNDPVKLIRIIKAGREIVPGKYELPEISSDHFIRPNPMDDWLKDTSFVVQNQSTKGVVSLGISVILVAKQTNADCHFSTGGVWGDRDPFCDVNPGWCDGGCPALLHRTVSWGRIPPETAAGLKARYRDEQRRISPWVEEGEPLEGKASLELPPGQEMTLSLLGRGDSWGSLTDPRKAFSDSINGILYAEGIDEAKGAAPCEQRANSKTGCAFAEVPKFNVGLDIVHFEDGAIWGNYGYGYALPTTDGIFKRVDATDVPGLAVPLPAAN